jgi:hypothetical protein
MNADIRTERSFGVTSHLEANQRVHLLHLRNSEVWPDLLDVMEMVCIELETKLINTNPDRPDEVLANHRMAKAAWLVFTHMQEKIDAEVSTHLASVAPKSDAPEMTAEEAERENILDPTRRYLYPESDEIQ